MREVDGQSRVADAVGGPDGGFVLSEHITERRQCPCEADGRREVVVVRVVKGNAWVGRARSDIDNLSHRAVQNTGMELAAGEAGSGQAARACASAQRRDHLALS